MIKFTLKCDQDHQFSSWFQSNDAFEKLKRTGHVTCAICGSAQVEKALMAPRVTTAEPAQDKLSAPATPAEQALRAMKEHVEKNSEYVGSNFASEARAMHLGETQDRPIWGEAKREDAKSLIEDGVPVTPLPFVPKDKSN